MPATHAAPYPRERVRLASAATSTGRGPANLHDELGFYHRVDAPSGRIRYSRADGPTPPFAVQTFVTAGPDDSGPRIALDGYRRIHLLWQAAGPKVLYSNTDDDGGTFATPMSLFDPAKHPEPVATDVGTVILAARVGTGIQAYERFADGTLVGPWVFVDDAAAPLVIDDDCFGISRAAENTSRYVLVVTQSGATQEWASADDCRSFILVS